MSTDRTIFIGDVHGTIDEFREILQLVDVKSPNVRVICLGDLNDRGPDSVGCIRLAKELNLECIRGNHEDRLIKWLHNNGPKSSKNYYDQLSKDDISYIENMPSYIELDAVIAVHAGVKPNIPMPQQRKDDLMYIRYTDKDRRFISLKKINKHGKEELGAMFWTEFGPFNKNIVYGHNVHSLTDIRIDRYDNGTAAYGIDTGCCFGGNLSALLWETKEIVQVKAKKIYYQSDFNIR